MSSEKVRRKLIDAKRQLAPKDLHHKELKEKVQGKPAAVKKFKNRASRLRSLEKQWAPYKEAIAKYIANKTKDSGNLPEKISRIRNTLKSECPHPIEFLEVEESYFDGDYLNTSYTDYYVTCTKCGHRQKVDHKNHGHYG